ncbi:MAG: alpha/beta fold hydrolase [Thermoguttaceae bacterium]|jgi:haloalkane dehalogenase|nr:alpha/beta fold hydrolase [Thermoguttaceae bacterium]
MPQRDDWQALYPFRPHELDVGGLRCHYVDEGEGAPVLMVHGNPTWSFYWRELIKGLSGQCRVVAPDHIGCGLSEKPVAGEYPFTLQRRIDDLTALIESLDLRAITLVAHDWGGAIGLGAAVAMPERFARLVLLNTAAFPSRRCPWRIRVCRTPVLGRLAVQGLNLFARSAVRMALHRPQRLSRAARAGLLAPYDSWRHRTAVYQFVHDIPLKASHPSYATLAGIEARLQSLAGLPALLIWGMRDWCFTPHFLDRFREYFPAARVVQIEDAGHYVVEEAADQILSSLREFLNQ